MDHIPNLSLFFELVPDTKRVSIKLTEEEFNILREIFNRALVENTSQELFVKKLITLINDADAIALLLRVIDFINSGELWKFWFRSIRIPFSTQDLPTDRISKLNRTSPEETLKLYLNCISQHGHDLVNHDKDSPEKPFLTSDLGTSLKYFFGLDFQKLPMTDTPDFTILSIYSGEDNGKPNIRFTGKKLYETELVDPSKNWNDYRLLTIVIQITK